MKHEKLPQFPVRERYGVWVRQQPHRFTVAIVHEDGQDIFLDVIDRYPMHARRLDGRSPVGRGGCV